MEPEAKVEKLPHHEQMEFCLSRARYRQGRRLTAVKVYTVNDESKFLIVSGVPAIKISRELEMLCRKYGQIDHLKLLPDYPHEEFSEVYLVKYQGIKCARFAKKQLDGKSFYGGVFHVCYAPELESVEETREKLQDRRRSIAALTKYKQDPSAINSSKKKYRNPPVGRYLSRLRPELWDPQSTPHSRIDASQLQDDSSMARTKAEEPNSSNNVYDSSIIPADLYKIPIALMNRDMTMKHPAGSVKKCNNFQLSESISFNTNNPLVPRSIKRPNDSSLLTTMKKKIRVFGNKSILSYKPSGD